jgi:hypothetical protein
MRAMAFYTIHRGHPIIVTIVNERVERSAVDGGDGMLPERDCYTGLFS